MPSDGRMAVLIGLRTADDRPYTALTGALCLRTARDAGPYGGLTEALFSRPFALKARGNTHRALGGPL